jgi:CubicO group peptidase (beta-lactamase class C family)
VNYALLGLIVERRSGQAFDDYCYETIFRPLGMDSTSWFLSGLDPRTIAIPYKVTKEGTEAIPHYGYPDYPDGQIRTTVEDLARFTSLYLNRGVAAGARVLEARTVEEILEVQYPDVNPNQAIAWNYDEFHHFLVRMFVGAKPAHTGGDPGVSTILVTDPETRSAVIVLMNGMAPGVHAQKAIYIDTLRRLCREAGIRR